MNTGESRKNVVQIINSDGRNSIMGEESEGSLDVFAGMRATGPGIHQN